MISVVIPFFNEEENAPILCDRLKTALDDLGQPYEVICVNDGSTDGTEAALEAVAAAEPRVKLISFARNFGQTAALMAGFDHSSGEVVVALDGIFRMDRSHSSRLERPSCRPPRETQLAAQTTWDGGGADERWLL